MRTKRMSWQVKGVMAVILTFVFFAGGQRAVASDDGSSALTADPEIAIDTLKVMLRPLGRGQLETELEAWVGLLKSKITEVGMIEIEIAEIGEKEEGEEADQGVEEVKELRDQFIALRTDEADLIARTKVVMDALTAKGGDASETISYIAAVSDLSASGDVESRAASVVAAAKSWLRSPEGGIQMLKKVGLALTIFIVFWFISRYAGKAVGKALEKRRSVSGLLTNFAKKMAGGLVFVVGVLMALSALGVSVGPLMAALGAGGFIVGFALQETLGSFASGLMIMIYRPFDVQDYVSIAGDEGVVKEMSLVSTTLLSLDNKTLIIPNKSVWGNTIINFTDEDLRRVDMVFGIGYGDDIPKAMKVLEEMASAHPLTLDEPKIAIVVLELADSSVNIGCRPWVKTSDYWPVMWELTKQIKMRFDEDGISIPFPQRDVHMIQD